MPLILGTNSIKDTGYDVANSLRLDRNSGASLSRTESQNQSDGKKITISVWCKLGSQLGSTRYFFGTSADGSFSNEIGFNSNDQLNFSCINNATNQVTTNRVFRDPSAWYHIVGVLDSTQGTDTNRIKLYVNGVQETSFASSSYPSQNAVTEYLKNGGTTEVGDKGSGGNNFDGYLAEVCVLDGQALTPTSFGEFDEDSGIWKPIDVSGLTFGTNGFYLDFENSGSLGADVSGNGNNFTVNNLTSIDQTTDTPTNNYATINPLFNLASSVATMSDGNLTILSTTSSFTTSPASLAFSSGKWYYEVKWLTGTSGDFASKVGWGNPDKGTSMNTQGSILYRNNTGNKFIDNSGSAYGATWTTANDIIGVAIDVGGGTVTFYKNGVSQGDITISGGLDDGTFIIPFIQVANTDKVSVNFGNPPFTISSGNSDGNSRGNFEYPVPNGYFALCTSNLAEHG